MFGNLYNKQFTLGKIQSELAGLTAGRVSLPNFLIKNFGSNFSWLMEF